MNLKTTLLGLGLVGSVAIGCGPSLNPAPTDNTTPDSGPVVTADAGTPATDNPAPAVDVPVTTTDAGPVQPTCPMNLTTCGALCSDLATDANNCGRCGVTCGSNAVCVAGACTLRTQPQPTMRCGDGSCTSVTGENCSTCAVDCGACLPTCTASQTLCGSTCMNTQSDVTNCGGCGTRCSVGQTCNAGRCTTPTPTCSGSGERVCSNGCTSLYTDVRNCGACGTTCASGQTCAGGVCNTPAPSCGAGLTLCGSVCVNLQTSHDQCGACGSICDSTWTCSAGRCRPPVAMMMVGGVQSFRVIYNAPAGTTVRSANIYQFTDSTTGYLQSACSFSGGDSGALSSFACLLTANPVDGYLDINTQVQLSPSERTRMGRDSTWAAAVYTHGGPLTAYGSMGIERTDLGLSLTVSLTPNGVDGGNFRAYTR